MIEEYNEYGDIKPQRKLNTNQEHRIHETKDMFDGDCYLCQKYAKKLQSYWAEGDEDFLDLE